MIMGPLCGLKGSSFGLKALSGTYHIVHVGVRARHRAPALLLRGGLGLFLAVVRAGGGLGRERDAHGKADVLDVLGREERGEDGFGHHLGRSLLGLLDQRARHLVGLWRVCRGL